MQIKQLRASTADSFYSSWRRVQSNFTKGWKEPLKSDNGSGPWHFSDQIGGQHIHGEFAWKYDRIGVKVDQVCHVLD